MSNEIKSESGNNVAIVGMVVFATVILVGGFFYMNSDNDSAGPAPTATIKADDNKLKIEMKTENGSIEYQKKTD